MLFRSGLVTGTLAALDCRPASSEIALITYFLARPPDARFTWNNRTREAGAADGADCALGIPGVEVRGVALSSACYVADGKANLRLAYASSCPGVYIGVLGKHGDVARLASAFSELTVGAPWTQPLATVTTCLEPIVGVTAPASPLGATLIGVTTAEPFVPIAGHPGYFSVTMHFKWTVPAVTADTKIEVWGVLGCDVKLPKNGADVPCVSASTVYPPSSLVLLASAPISAAKLTFGAVFPEVLGPVLFYDKGFFPNGRIYGGILVRATNGKASSSFVLPKNGTAADCYGCTA